MHALCAHAQGSVDLHVESYGVAGPLVETLYTSIRARSVQLSYLLYLASTPTVRTISPISLIRLIC